MTEARKKITLPYLFKKVADKEPITWLTCYDYPTAYLAGAGGYRDDSWSVTAWA